MNKFILSIVLSVIGSQTFAQVPNFQGGNVIVNPPNGISGARTYQFNDSNGNNRNIISPVPGVYIQQPQWVQDISEIARENRSGNNNRDNNVNNNDHEEAKPQVMPPVAPTPNQAINSALPNTALPNNQPIMPLPTKEVTKKKHTGQIPIAPPQINYTNISEFNNSTIIEFEEQGRKNLENAYRKF